MLSRIMRLSGRWTCVSSVLRVLVRVIPCGQLLRTKLLFVLGLLSCVLSTLSMTLLEISRFVLTIVSVVCLSLALVVIRVCSRLLAEMRIILSVLPSWVVRAFPLELGVLSRMTCTVAEFLSWCVVCGWIGCPNRYGKWVCHWLLEVKLT